MFETRHDINRFALPYLHALANQSIWKGCPIMFENSEFEQFLNQMAQDKIAFFEALNSANNKEGIVLLGDSLVENFPIYEMYKGEQHIYNRGVSGNTTYDVLERLEKTVFSLTPSKVFVLVGTNDLLPGVPENHEAAIASRILEIAHRLNENNRGTKVFIQSLYPINASNAPHIKTQIVANRSNKQIDKINDLVKSLCEAEKHVYIDVHQHLMDEKGQLDAKYTLDGIHINYKAYTIVLKILNHYFN